ncbi:MAG: hypothetical protein J7L14_03725, partial [Candidatus Diapherotrites archaeon]|nr:hypothetical protein [Candidatus Diapherotrites archaeon]
GDYTEHFNEAQSFVYERLFWGLDRFDPNKKELRRFLTARVRLAVLAFITRILEEEVKTGPLPEEQ